MIGESTPILLDKQQIANLIPHSGEMCLLDQVTFYDHETIHCLAISHRSPSNPLLENGQLNACCGIEYAAQAMAIHGALNSKPNNSQPRGGRLAGVRSADFYVDRLDDITEDLQIKAHKLLADDNSMVYEFSIFTLTKILLQGRATVILTPLPS